MFGLNPTILAGQLEGTLRSGSAGVVSFGLAGGLDPELRPGSWIVADDVVLPDSRYACDAAWSDRLALRLGAAYRGGLAWSREPVRDPAAKADLFARTGAIAVDMESGLAAPLAARYRVPLVVARVIVDPAQRTLPSSALAALRSDGGIALGGLFGELARHPLQLLDLLRLAREAGQARRSLSEGLGRIGPRFALEP